MAKLIPTSETLYKYIIDNHEYLIDISDYIDENKIPFVDNITKCTITDDTIVPKCPNCGQTITRHVHYPSERTKKFHCTNCNKYYVKEFSQEIREVSYREWRCMMDSVFAELIRLHDALFYRKTVETYSSIGEINEQNRSTSS